MLLPTREPRSPLFLLKEPLFSAFIGNAAKKHTNKETKTNRPYRFSDSVTAKADGMAWLRR